MSKFNSFYPKVISSISGIPVAIFVFIFILMPVGCREVNHDSRLMQIADIVSANPHKALAYLDSIDYSGLSEKDRHYYDFLSIKGRDKAFIDHESDSLILDVIRYASSHLDEGWYAEALYYGGRVYSDIGDYPTALHYFQDALSVLEAPSDNKSLEFKGNILSQTGGALHNLRLYSQAIPYLRQSIQISKELGDTFGIVYDNAMLCHLYMNIDNIDSAKRCNSVSMMLSPILSQTDRSNVEIDKAALLYKAGRIDSALIMVRYLPMTVDSLCVNYALSIASQIYLDAGVLDTAYMYAKKLATSKMQDNKRIGFKVMFSPQMSNMVPKDTLLSYIPLYKEELEKQFDQHDAQQAIIQNANYNYQLHVREKIEAQAKTSDVKTILVIALFVILLLIMAVMMMQIRTLRQQVQLRRYLELLKKLRLERSERSKKSENPDKSVDVIYGKDSENIRLKILEELKELDNSDIPPVSETILESSGYRQLRQLISERKVIREEHMKQLENIIDDFSPNFKTRLGILTGGKLRKSDLEIAILVRYGVSPSEMAMLLNIMKNSISSRRASLARKIFGEDSSTKSLDKLIRSL